MKTIFKKAHLPLIDQAVHHHSDTHATYALYHKMRCEDGLDRAIASEILLLTRGAERGDPNAMVELARHYFYDYDTSHIPYALSWWRRAILTGSDIAVGEWHQHRGEFLRRISAYAEGRSAFTDIVMRCAMLTEYYLFDLGLVDWTQLDTEARLSRTRALVQAVAPVLGINAPTIDFVPGLTFTDEKGNTMTAYGLAHPRGHIDILLDMASEREWLIQVLFHEIGHFVCFAAMGNDARAAEIRRNYGLTNERIESWNRGDMGIEVPTSQEDPDTLSYAVYTHWAVMFADCYE